MRVVAKRYGNLLVDAGDVWLLINEHEVINEYSKERYPRYDVDILHKWDYGPADEAPEGEYAEVLREWLDERGEEDE